MFPIGETQPVGSVDRQCVRALVVIQRLHFSKLRRSLVRDAGEQLVRLAFDEELLAGGERGEFHLGCVGRSPALSEYFGQDRPIAM